jgi:hypothetical protein
MEAQQGLQQRCLTRAVWAEQSDGASGARAIQFLQYRPSDQTDVQVFEFDKRRLRKNSPLRHRVHREDAQRSSI